MSEVLDKINLLTSRQVTQPAYAKRSPTIITASAICRGRYVS